LKEIREAVSDRGRGGRQESRAAYDKAIEFAGNTAETASLTRRRD
jgi:RNA polymerase sigma-70 factor (ECF subfamily)